MTQTQVIRPVRLGPASRVSLAPAARLDSAGITDEAAGGRYQLNATAVDALTLLSRGLTLEEASAQLAAAKGAAPQAVFADLTDLLTSLDQFDLLVVDHAPLLRRLRALFADSRYLLQPMAALVAMQTALALDWKRSPGRRYAVTPAGLLLAGVRAMRWAIVAGCVLVPLLLAYTFVITGKTPGVGLARYGEDLAKPVLITAVLLA